MIPDTTQQQLGWPAREAIFSPVGPGPRVYADLAERKLGQPLRSSGIQVEVGILAADPASTTSEAPLAVVCDFPRHLSEPQLAKLLGLAWSFCRTPVLITLEPSLVRAWTCYERPPDAGEESSPIEIVHTDQPLSEQAVRSLHWCELVSGSFLQRHEKRFQGNQRADAQLLANLRYARQLLHSNGLAYSHIHDLLARLIFVQFLFDRKDSNGKAALDAGRLGGLCEDGILGHRHSGLAGILSDHGDAYRFFRWLNDRFNGDLFPGKVGTSEEMEAEWAAEMDAVKPEHLGILADFVSGELEMAGGQYSLWRLYSFDAIPLEFISSIYQEFVSGVADSNGAHYTPAHLVDLVLDGVLPWGGTDWDLRVLDPACGSGIFLVKAFQRLVHRWRNANPDGEPSARTLKRLLERNIVGVDINPDAVRVASFSLYLAMCDEIDPKHYWTQVKFPVLRDRSLVSADFFRDHLPPFRTADDAGTFDLVVGNAPWGKQSVTPTAGEWAQRHSWPVVNKQLGTLFLPKAAALTKANGRVSMLQPAEALLLNHARTCLQFRRKLFSSFRVEEVINLAALRANLFPESVDPVCAITLRPVAPSDEPISYCCPKRTRTPEDGYRIVADPHDTTEVFADEALESPWVWSALAWGSRRDLALLRKLKQLRRLRGDPSVVAREGFIRGDRAKRQPQIVGRHCIGVGNLPEGMSLRLPPSAFPVNSNDEVHSRDSTDFRAFLLPQVVVKQSWSVREGRFRAVLIDDKMETQGVICSQSFVSIHVDRGSEPTLEAVCLVLNSAVAPYYLLLTSGRFASYRPEPLVGSLLDVPIPPLIPGLLDELRTDADVDDRARRAFELSEAEWALVEDLTQFTLPDFKGGEDSPGRQPTRRLPEQGHGDLEPDLQLYADYFLRVLEAGFGADKAACATVFHEAEQRFPLRLIAVHLGCPGRERVVLESADYGKLAERLNRLSQWLAGGLSRRAARVYDSTLLDGKKVPTVYIAKPDQRRYWTRSAAMRDADAVAADIVLWRASAEALQGGARA